MPFNGNYPITQEWANGGQHIDWQHAVGGHPGVDYGVPSNTPLYAVMDGGIVNWAGPAEGFGDHCVAIYYPAKNVTILYGHGCAHYVQVGHTVQYGQLVALSDNEGWSTGPHVHVEVRPGNVPFGGNPPNWDPVVWFYMAIMASEDDMQYIPALITDMSHAGTVQMFKEAVTILNPKVSWKDPIQTVEQVRSFLAANGHPEVNDLGSASRGTLTVGLQQAVLQLALESKNRLP